ncbi:MAG: hypothetical protein LBH37_04905 [Oscillospiraceae bacterium]|jgi:V/A-type H+-transporting ATPase subunit E|nr:hypothetical protein [Oscillospiraceae bacterium]
MLNEIEKTNNFLNAINKYAEEQRTKIRREGKNFKEKELEEAEREALKEAYSLIQKEMATVRSEVENEISKEELAGRREISKLKENICEDIFKLAKNALIRFTETDEYFQIIVDSLKKISEFNLSETLFLLKAKDRRFFQNIKDLSHGKCEIEVSEKIEIGGIIAFNSKLNIFIDETLDAKLEREKKWFIANCGIGSI